MSSMNATSFDTFKDLDVYFNFCTDVFARVYATYYTRPLAFAQNKDNVIILLF